MQKIILLVFALSLYTTNAQEFKTTNKYTLTNVRSMGQEEEGKALIDLVVSEDRSNRIATVEITELELLEGIQITVLSNPNLEEISEILKVEVEYAACCSSTEGYYFLVTDAGDFIALPRLENLYCDTTRSDTHYVFPSQAFGQEGMVLRAALQYNETYTVKDIKVLQGFVWKDDDFDYKDAITASN